MNRPDKKIYLRCFLIIPSIILLVIFLYNLTIKKTIQIGFAAQLTGTQAELGVQDRNGVQLAIEAINASGGVAGRKIELIIRDDYGIPEQAKAVDRDLIKAGVSAIIGHATSAQTFAGLEVTNPAKVVMLGPTISTPKLSGIEDYFFRVCPSFNDSAQTFTQYIYQHDKVHRLAIIYDNDNAAYAKTYSTVVTAEFRSLGGKITNEISFSSVMQPNFSQYLSQLHLDKADGLMIIASDMDTALIAQKTRLLNYQIPLYTSSWAPTQTLIINGGQAVDGMKLPQVYALASETPLLQEFQARYQNRYGHTPSFGAALAYDTTLVLAEALKKTGGRPEGLQQALRETQNFQGLMGTFSFDRFGDVERQGYLCSIHNGKFVNLEKMPLLKPGDK